MEKWTPRECLGWQGLRETEYIGTRAVKETILSHAHSTEDGAAKIEV